MSDSQKKQINTKTIEFLRILHPPGTTFEIRSPKCPEWSGSNKRSTAAGWFTDHDKAGSAIERIEELKPPAIYVSLNPCNPALVGRCHNKTKFGGSTTADGDTTRRTAVMIDIDPVRLSDTSSTEEQMTSALAMADEIGRRLSASQWPEPLRGMSGNGAYLIYRVDLPNDEACTQLVKNCMLALSQQYSTPDCNVDTTTFNASRICKVLGTMARKGEHIAGVDGVPDMPHRRSWFFSPEQPLQPVKRELLEALAIEYEPPTATSTTVKTSSFDLIEWIRKYAVPVSNPQPYAGGQKWLFNELPPPCQMHPGGHSNDGSGFLIRRADGTIQAGCQHERCTWRWRDLRLTYEPGAFDYQSRSTVGVDLSGVDSQPVGKAQAKQEPTQEQAEPAQQAEPEPEQEAEPEQAKTKPKAEEGPTSPASHLLVQYFNRIKSGELQQLTKQPPALEGIEIGPGLLTVFGAPPGFGKTALAMQVMFDALALEPELLATVANAETTFDGLLRRELTRTTRINSDAIRFGNLTEHDLAKITDAVAELIPRMQRVNVLNDPNTLSQLLRLRSEPPGMLIVDYLQKFAPSDRDARQGVGDVMAGLRMLAKLDWTIVCLSATSRGKDGKHDSKQLNLSSFRESGEIEYNADSAYLLLDNGPTNEQTPYIRHVTLQHVKNRHGAKIDRELMFHMPAMSFDFLPSASNEFGRVVNPNDPNDPFFDEVS